MRPVCSTALIGELSVLPRFQEGLVNFFVLVVAQSAVQSKSLFKFIQKYNGGAILSFTKPACELSFGAILSHATEISTKAAQTA